ncbi:MAG: hypothetical protein KAJ58_02745 [Candidatus Pacebacteria bacterium]|nr:hypothetical protein [Candidatus Paceibacterota bacterium]
MRKKIKNKIKKILEINTSILVLVTGILIFSGITSAALIYGIVSDSKASLVGYWPLDEESEKGTDGGFDVSTAVYDSVFSVASQDTDPKGITFNTAGTKMFVVGDAGNDINEYHCSTGFDVSTCAYDSAFSVGSQEASPHGVAFNLDGTKMFVSGNAWGRVNEYHCTTGFDISTCSHDSTLSVSTYSRDPTGIAFNATGSKLFLTDWSGDEVNEYHCSTNFDISTCSYDSNFLISNQSRDTFGLAFNSDGTKMFVVGRNEVNNIIKHHCITGFDLSTCSYDSVFYVGNQDAEPHGVAFNSDGTKMFVVGTTGDEVNEYHLDPPIPITGDKTGNSNDGIIYGATLTTDQMGQSNRAMSFDGVDDYIVVSSNSMISESEGSVSLWAKFDEIDKDQIVIISGNVSADGESSEDKLFIMLRGLDNKIVSGWQTGGEPDFAVSSNTIVADNWYQLTLTWSLSANRIKIFVDTVETLGDVLTGDNKNSWVDELRIGRAMSGGINANVMDGSISDIRIYNQALTATEIQSLYEQYRPKTQVSNLQKGLVGQWALDSESLKSSTITGDKTPYENDGTISGAILTTDQMGQSNRAMSFDGVDDYIELSSEITLEHGSWSIGYWFLQDANSNMTIGEKDANANRFYHQGYSLSSAYIRIHFDDAAYIDALFGKAVNDGWHHVVVTASGDTITTHTDGIQSDTDTMVTNQFVIDVIGNPYTGTTYIWDGKLSDVRIYNRALNTTEINNLYHSYRPRISPGSLQKGLVGSWPLDTESEKTKQGGFDVSTAVYDSVFPLSTQDTHPYGIAFNTDGTKMFIPGNDGDDVNEYHCTTGFDVSTCSYDSVFSFSAQETEPRGIAFNTNGTQMYIVGVTGDDVNEYHCTAAFDVSTCSYDSVFSVSAQDSNPHGIAFNPSGTKMFIVGITGVDVNEYHCSTGFDVSTCSYNSNFSVSAQESLPIGIAFNTNGTQMYIVGVTGDDVNEYHCTTAFDVSTCSYDSVFSVSAQETDSRYISFNRDGSKMFIIGGNGDDVNEYHLDPPVSITGDKTPYSNDGTITGPTSTTGKDGESDGALSFDGVDDYVEITDSTAFDVDNDGFTYTAWIKGDSFSKDYNMIMSRHIPYLEIRNTNKLHLSIKDGSDVQRNCYGTTILQTDTWYFVSATYDSDGYMKVFVNGEQDGTTTGPYSSITNPSCNQYIGQYDNGSYEFDGSISDVRIYNRALSAEEIDLLYHRR